MIFTHTFQKNKVINFFFEIQPILMYKHHEAMIHYYRP